MKKNPILSFRSLLEETNVSDGIPFLFNYSLLPADL